MGADEGRVVMRITEKMENGFYALRKKYEIWGEENGIRLVQIVGPLEDAKEKYGIDVLLLLEAMSNGIYYIGSDGVIRYVRQSEFWLSNSVHGYGFVYDVRFIYFHDYGKKIPGGWALTKEELE